MTLEDAIILAAERHCGQRDKGNEPYILHPLRVALSVRTDHERLDAVLHDVIEDTGVTLEDLRERGLDGAVIGAIEVLTNPWPCTILTSPAVHANAVRRYVPERTRDIEAVMARRIRRVLAVAAGHDRRALVLGAWGCGAFGNDPEMVARLFREALAGEFAGVFAEVVFVVTDWSQERRFIGPFQRSLEAGKVLRRR